MSEHRCDPAQGLQCWLVVLMSLTSVSVIFADPEPPVGHLKPLGSHIDPKGVPMSGIFPRASTLYRHFVEPGFPGLLRGALNVSRHPGLQDWTDDYLREHFGMEMVNVEHSKKENRLGTRTSLPLRQFLDLYQTEDLYLVQSLTGKMTELVLVPESLQCGGFQRVLQEAVLWLASGTSASVLHYDGLDNLLCVMDGRKDVVLIDKSLKALVEMEGFHPEGGYSDLDVDRVDLERYSHLRNVQWYKAPVQKGDCVFIPKGWYHHVRSSGQRHLAVNLWLSHLWWFNRTDCTETDSLHPLMTLQDFGGFASPNEVYRSKLLESLENNNFANRTELIHALNTTPDRAEQFWDAIDKKKDPFICMTEMYGFDIDLAVLKFPDVFGLPYQPSGADQQEKVILYRESTTENNEIQDLNDDDNDDYNLEETETVRRDGGTDNADVRLQQENGPTEDLRSSEALDLEDDNSFHLGSQTEGDSSARKDNSEAWKGRLKEEL